MLKPNSSVSDAAALEARALVRLLDANVLAKPFTRTLLWAGSVLSGFRVTWSRLIEEEARNHLARNAAPLARLRALYGLDLSPSGEEPERFAATDEKDQQVLADAVAAGVNWLVTENVRHIGLDDLDAVGLVAVHPDLFMAHHLTQAGYGEALDALSAGMTNPARTPAAVHAATNRRHPLLFAAHADLFPVVPDPVADDYPDLLFRGHRCVRCLRPLADPEGLRSGIGQECRTIID
jgi:hypothetical protein